MKKNFNLAEEDYGLGDQTKQLVGRMLEKREIKLSSDHPHVGRNMRNRHQMSQEQGNKTYPGWIIIQSSIFKGKEKMVVIHL